MHCRRLLKTHTCALDVAANKHSHQEPVSSSKQRPREGDGDQGTTVLAAARQAACLSRQSKHHRQMQSPRLCLWCTVMRRLPGRSAHVQI